jgi:mono/diheme cytochrome c family protein
MRTTRWDPQKPRGRQRVTRLAATAGAWALAAWLVGASVSLAWQSEPQPTPTADRLAPPPMPDEPTQADQGALVYYYICMACHGDRGQGLTDEFRSLWAPGDQNCWQAKCHGPNYPPNGFEIVRYVPPVVSEKALAKSLNAQQLYNYVSSQMPWQAPGTLTEEEYWQLTAFLMRANGVDIGDEPLGPANAAGVPAAEAENASPPDLPEVAPPDMPPHGGSPDPLLWVALLALLIVGALASIWLVRRARSARE